MYRPSPPTQPSCERFSLPFSGNLASDNRWVKLAEVIPWKEFEPQYAQQFSQTMGATAKPFRMALGSLIIKEKLGTSDRETVAQISENPYLQYFLGLSEYQQKAPFDASMLVHFRQRLGPELVLAVNESVVAPICSDAQAPVPEPSSSSEDTSAEDRNSPKTGQLILDATCAPSDIHYPTDLSLLNDARKWSERLIDALYGQLKDRLSCKPRTYRRVARRRYLSIARKRKPSRRLVRKGIGQQLRYVRRNLAHIEALVEAGAQLCHLSRREYRMLLVIAEVYRQQLQMYQSRTHRLENRIVSLSQPHVRPIVRGKARTPVEFGAKLSVSCVDGYVFLDHLDWEAFNESTHLKQQAEAFRTRFGHYPTSIHADQIYRTRANLRWCKQQGIRLSGPPLGRPSSNKTVQAQLKQQAKKDEAVRVQIEGKFGQAKRRFSLGRVMAKLAQTAQTSIAITFLVMNLERWLRCLCLFLFFAVSRTEIKACRPSKDIAPQWSMA